jgi:hypothetical protein
MHRSQICLRVSAMTTSKPSPPRKPYDIKERWHWGRGMRHLRISDFLMDGRILVPGDLTGDGPATDDGTGALRTVGGIQVGSADYETGYMWVGRRLQEGDLPGKPRT